MLCNIFGLNFILLQPLASAAQKCTTASYKIKLALGVQTLESKVHCLENAKREFSCNLLQNKNYALQMGVI